jgi:hypothetical protein
VARCKTLFSLNEKRALHVLKKDVFASPEKLASEYHSRQWQSHQYGEPWRPPHLATGKSPHPPVILAGLLAAAQLHYAITELLSLETNC